MSEYDPQDARQQGEENIRSQFSQPQLPGFEERYSNDPQVPIEKQAGEAVGNLDKLSRNWDSVANASERHAAAMKKIVEIQKIQRGESQQYLDILKKVESFDSQKLKNEMHTNNLLKLRKEVSKDLADYDKKGYDQLSVAQKLRIKDYEAALAHAKALKQVIPGMSSMDLPAALTQDPRALLEQAAPGGMGGQLRRGVGGSRAANWMRQTYLGRQVSETARAAGGVNLADPGSLLRVARSMPLVSAGLTALYELRGLGEGRGLSIPGVGAVPFSDWQTQLAAGQVTGEGYGAGLAARGEAIRMGLNPFDQISMQVANAIVSAVRGQGFRGAMAREFENSIKDIYKDTGLPVEQIAEMGRLYARGGHLDNFRSQMQSLDDIAKNTSNSVNTVAETFKSFTDTLVGQGGQRNIPLVPAMTRLVANLTGPGGAFAGQFTQFFQQAGQYAGLTPTAAATPAGQRQTRQALMTFLPQMRNQLSGLDDQTLGLMIDSGAFPGITNVDALRTLLEKGPGQISQVGSLVRQSQMRGFFDQAELRRRNVHHDPNLLGKALHVAGILTPGIAVPWGGGGHEDRTPEREAYVRSLTRSLEGTKLTTAQREEILRPLRRSARGADVDFQGRHLDWDQTVRLARTRADRFTERAQRGDTSLTIRLDPAETRRLLGGKNVSKSVQLEHAAEGAARYVGTAFADNLP